MTYDGYIEIAERLPLDAPAFVIAFAVAIGMMVGSFANVLIYRLPRNCLSIVKPGSHCPICDTPIKWYDNIPFFAWAIWLGRKCRKCKTPIPWMYPAVELLVGVMFGAFAYTILCTPESVWFQGQYWLVDQFVPPDQVLLAPREGDTMLLRYVDELSLSWRHYLLWALWSAAGVTLLVASWIDAQMKIIPDSISMGGTIVVLLLAPLVPHLHSWGVPAALVADPLFYSTDLEPWLRAWLTTGTLMFGAAAFLYSLGIFGSLIARKEAQAAGGAMGFGDVKLIMLLAGLLGWPKLVLAFVIAVFAGAVLGAPRLYKKLKGDENVRTDIPFGPFLAFGTLAAMLFSNHLFALVLWYVEMATGAAG